MEIPGAAETAHAPGGKSRDALLRAADAAAGDAFARAPLRRGLVAFLDASILSASPGRGPGRGYAWALDGG